jgi:protein MpaA
MLVPRTERGIIRHIPEVYGQTRLGAPLELWLPAQKKADLLLIAGIHGDEPETTVLLSAALRALKPELLQSAVILAANPDGLARGTRGNAIGVDLNRNFPASNWTSQPVEHRWREADPQDVQLSPGAKPASEPETQALLALLEKIKPAAVVSLHGNLGWIDDATRSPLGQWIARESKLPLVDEPGYTTPGSFGSWARENNLLVITYELTGDSIENHRTRHESTLLTLLQGSLWQNKGPNFD